MKVSLNWLKNYVDVSDLSLETLSHNLTMSGLEVESIEEIGKELQDFVVGEVLEKKQHPNADKLSVCIVDNGKEKLQVVCGAPNVKAGQKIVFAPVGAVIPNSGEKLKKAKIRGVESNGMICSEAELNIGKDHSGIMVLNDSAVVGESILEYFKLKDVTLEIGITPNRPDALSHIGVARDISAIFNKQLFFPKINFNECSEKITDRLEVQILNPIDCPRYVARYVKNVKVQESPTWLKNYLINVGLRPVNNIVDVSNFVMLEFGQPLHTFDADLVEGKKIIVKNANDGDEFITLDEKKRKLTKDNLMICDAVKPIAIAGVMGGQNSEIKPNTKDVIIESAYFNPVSIRRTSKYLQLSTDSSYRFERGVDFNNTLIAANRAAQLIAELSGGEILEGAIDVYPNPIPEQKAILRYKRVNEILGTNISEKEIDDILVKLGFKLNKLDEEKSEVTIPSFRPDCTREIDLIEEIARIYSYNKIATDSRINISLSSLKREVEFDTRVRDILVSFGLNEVLNNTLVSFEHSCFNNYQPVKVLNPISSELSHLRSSLIPSLLMNVSLNKNKFIEDVKIFEIGNCFRAYNTEIKDFSDYNESTYVAICLTGLVRQKSWKTPEEVSTIYHLKGIVEGLFEKLYLDKVNYNYYYDVDNKYFSSEIKIFSEEKYLGSFYEISRDYLKSFDLDNPVFVCEIDLNLLKELKKRKVSYKRLSNYPAVERDISFFIDININFNDIENCIRRNSDRLLKFVYLFDQYTNLKVNDKKSLSIRFEFQSDEKTLTSEEVDKKLQKIITGLEKEFNIQLRDSA